VNYAIGSTSSRRSQHSVSFVLLAVAAVVALAFPACNSSSSTPGLGEGLGCHLNSDCVSGLFCALGACRAQCATAADCQAGGTCIDNGDVAVCQYASENNTPCDKESDCPAPLACAADYRCRNLCMTAADCNVLGITGRVCAMDANGVDFCAIPSEVNAAGVIDAPPPAGAPDTGVMEPLDATVGVVADGAPAANDVSSDTIVNQIPDATMTETSTMQESLDSGDASTATCSPACGYGMACSNGMCVACGASGAPCCVAPSTACGVNLSCGASGKCECGNPNEACCNGNTCQDQIACVTPDGGQTAMCSCGSTGATCCPSGDGGAPTCESSALTCAGIKCSCIKDVVRSYSTVIVQRFDGTFWEEYYPAAFAQVQWPSGGSASAMAVSGTTYETGQPPLQEVACGILEGGAVWCFPPSGSTSDSVYLGAGLGPSVTTSSPVQVVTSVGVSPTPLANAIQISGNVSGYGAIGNGGPAICAVISDGSIWCWGDNTDGLLGHGDTVANVSYARQVMANATTPFTGAVEVRVGPASACARKTDGSVWCWGDNSYAELGFVSTTTTNSPFPVQVSLLGAATHLGESPWLTFCAIIQDTSVVCWGENNDLQAGAPSAASNAVGPTSVLVAAGGAALQGVLDVAPDDSAAAMCASTTTSGLVCWGNAVQIQGGSRSLSPYPAVVYDPGTGAPVQGVNTPLAWGSNMTDLTYVNPYGLLVIAGAGATPASIQPPCP
jgi:Regulator of Chromosome Condensation (RCC1) repeat protein